MLPSSAGAEIGPEENSEAAGPISYFSGFRLIKFIGSENARTRVRFFLRVR